MTTPLLIADLKRDEGCRLTAYEDTVGVWTCGYGHAHVAPGTVWTQEQADQQLSVDVAQTLVDLDKALPWWTSLEPVRQDALANMAFNLGIPRLLGFKVFLADLQAKNWAAASAAMLMSKWADQVGDRAMRLSRMIRTGSRIASVPQPEVTAS